MSTDVPDVPDSLAQVFSEMARLLVSEPSAQAVLDRIVLLATSTIEHCESAGITQIVGRKVISPASSGRIAVILDQIQGEVDEGPCLDALRKHEVFHTGDLATESRWPTFVNRARRETGVSSILSVRLYIEANTLGSLNLYSTQRHAFSPTDIAVATMFATHASIAISNSARLAQLAERADSRDLIGRAKGILMALQHVDEGRAFEMLVEASQRMNVKLAAIAEEVNRTGQIRRPGQTRSGSEPIDPD